MRDNARTITVLGLVVGAIGIGVLRAAGIDFPVAIPPVIVILLAGALAEVSFTLLFAVDAAGTLLTALLILWKMRRRAWSFTPTMRCCVSAECR